MVAIDELLEERRLPGGRVPAHNHSTSLPHRDVGRSLHRQLERNSHKLYYYHCAPSSYKQGTNSDFIFKFPLFSLFFLCANLRCVQFYG